MKPMIILPPGVMDKENIELLRENGICVVVTKDPAKVRFVDPIPAVSSRTQVEQAAILLSRKLLSEWPWAEQQLGRNFIARLYCEILTKGTPLDVRGTVEEQREQAYDQAYIEEGRRLAREEARAERAKKKLEKEKAK